MTCVTISLDCTETEGNGMCETARPNWEDELLAFTWLAEGQKSVTKFLIPGICGNWTSSKIRGAA